MNRQPTRRSDRVDRSRRAINRGQHLLLDFVKRELGRARENGAVISLDVLGKRPEFGQHVIDRFDRRGDKVGTTRLAPFVLTKRSRRHLSSRGGITERLADLARPDSNLGFPYGSLKPLGDKEVAIGQEKMNRKVPTRMSTGEPKPASDWQAMMRADHSPLLSNA